MQQQQKPYKNMYDLARQIMEQFEPLEDQPKETTAKSKPSGLMSKDRNVR